MLKSQVLRGAWPSLAGGKDQLEEKAASRSREILVFVWWRKVISNLCPRAPLEVGSWRSLDLLSGGRNGMNVSARALGMQWSS